VNIRAGSEVLIKFRLGISVNRQGSGSDQSTFATTPNSTCWIQHPLQFFVFILFLVLPGCAFAQGGACPAGLPVTGNNCYFIAANGSDSNSGTTESSPWLHAPGMPSCSGVCASATPSPGQGFVFRGGDSWHFGNSSASPYTGGAWDINQWWGTAGNNCQYEGSQTACIYWGVDKSWFSGASWKRPVLTGDNPVSTSLVSKCTYQIKANSHDTSTNVLIVAAPQSIIDNFELTGVCSSDPNPTSGVDDTYIEYFGTGTAGTGMEFLENLYIHGWTATTTAGQSGDNQPGTLLGGGYNGLNTFDHLVIDGSDSNPGSWAWATFPSIYHMRDSIVRYTNQGVAAGWCHDIHDNIFEHFYNHNAGAGSHTNILECNDDSSGNAANQPQNTPNVFYDNIIRHDDPSYLGSGQVHLWFCPENVPEYWFNNLLYDLSNDNVWDYAGPPIYTCSGSGGQYMFNNTLVDVTQPCYVSNVNHGGQYLTVFDEQLINTTLDSGSTACNGYNNSTNIATTDAQAITQAYLQPSGGTVNSDTCNNEGTTPCAPTSSSDSTVSAGANHEAYCTKLASYTGESAISVDAANACKNGTTDGCSYDDTSHTMNCPAFPAVLRPTSAAWDSGAYQFSGMPAPTNLSGSFTPLP
jgi:hypothetical protein